jgi:hypothetical protein
VELGIGHESMKDALVEGVEAALALGRLHDAEDLLAIVAAIPPGRQSPYLDAQAHRLRAKAADLRGGEDVEPGFKRAAGMLRELEMPFWMAVTLLEQAEWLVRRDRAEDAKPLLDEAREIFERLEATPWIERVNVVPLDRTTTG